MITEEFVIIPVEVRAIVHYGIGSVRIYRNGSMDFITPAGESFGKRMQEKFRKGEITALLLEAVTRPDEDK